MLNVALLKRTIIGILCQIRDQGAGDVAKKDAAAEWASYEQEKRFHRTYDCLNHLTQRVCRELLRKSDFSDRHELSPMAKPSLANS